MDEEERAMLEMAEIDDIEDFGIDQQESAQIGKKRKKPVKIQFEQELEYEFDQPKKEVEKIKVGGLKKRKNEELF